VSQGRKISTVYLGEFTWEHANDIAGDLEAAGIVWWYKQPGFLSRIWEHGVRLFVDREHLEDAQAIARRVLSAPPQDPHPEGEGSSSGQA
jgi:hypothetical protein